MISGIKFSPRAGALRDVRLRRVCLLFAISKSYPPEGPKGELAKGQTCQVKIK